MGRQTRRTEMLKAIGSAVKSVRESDPGQTQKQVADRVAELDETCPFRNQPTIADLELGNYNAQLEDIGTLATALGCSWTDLLEPAFAVDLGRAVLDSGSRARELHQRVLVRQQQQVEAFLADVDGRLDRPQAQSLLEDLAVLPTDVITVLAKLVHDSRETVLPTFTTDPSPNAIYGETPSPIPAESAHSVKTKPAKPTKARKEVIT
jgi:transcriptional regulator with XRE-family HTH domain